MALPRFLSAQLRQPSGWFGSLVVGPMMNRGNRRIVDCTIALLEVQPHHHVLEVGFGGGYGLACLARLVSDGLVCGVDFSPDMVRATERRFCRQIAQGRVNVQLGDISRLPFSPETFDRVLTVNTVYFWPDPPRGFSEIRRVLKDGGRAAVSLRSKTKMEKHPPNREIFRLFEPAEVARLMEEAGFRDVGIDHRDRDKLLDSVVVVGSR